MTCYDVVICLKYVQKFMLTPAVPAAAAETKID
jgi:hypothetical protein